MSEKLCPSKGVLSDYLLGKLPDGDVVPIQSHVEFCNSCQTTIQDLSEDGVTLVEPPGQTAQQEVPIERWPPGVEPVSLTGTSSGEERAAKFNPYHKWLGIAPKHLPADHYRLLAIEQFEDDADVIEHAADRRMSHVRNFQSGEHAQAAERILNEISQAKLCLLDNARKAEYDQHLRDLQSTPQLREVGVPNNLWPTGKQPTSVEEFLQCLAASGLMSVAKSRDLLKELPDGTAPQNARQTAEAMVSTGRFTRFQARAIYRGKPQGLLLGEYEILDKLGAGGMGIVYKARHRRMQRLAAIKVLLPGRLETHSAVRRFQQEVQAAASLEHQNIVLTYDAGEKEGLHFLVMQYIAGQDLAKQLEEQGPLPVEVVVDYIQQAALGLQYAHDQGVVHRDVKPNNLLVDENGVVKILDLGLARLRAEKDAGEKNDDLTGSGQIMGTIDFMSPEQAENTRAADHRSDIYSLGCTLYRLLTDQPIYPGSTKVERLFAHRVSKIPSLQLVRAEVSPQLEEVFRRMVAKLPQQRFASMMEVHDALEQLDQLTVPIAETADDKSAPYVPLPQSEKSLGDLLDEELSSEPASPKQLEEPSPGVPEQRFDPPPTRTPLPRKKVEQPRPERSKKSGRKGWYARVAQHPGLVPGIIATLVVIFIVVLGPLALLAIVNRAQQGSLRIDTDDSQVQAIVRQDHRVVGSLTNKNNWKVVLPPGEYQLDVEGPGIDVRAQQIKIVQGEVTRLEVKNIRAGPRR